MKSILYGALALCLTAWGCISPAQAFERVDAGAKMVYEGPHGGGGHGGGGRGPVIHGGGGHHFGGTHFSGHPFGGHGPAVHHFSGPSVHHTGHRYTGYKGKWGGWDHSWSEYGPKTILGIGDRYEYSDISPSYIYSDPASYIYSLPETQSYSGLIEVPGYTLICDANGQNCTYQPVLQ